MTDIAGSGVWTAREPDLWPPLPEYLTFSALLAIEACPRRWALSSAAYPHVWHGRGYPPRPNIAATAGIVVHEVIETLSRSLVRARCSSVLSPGAVEVMRELGGFTKLVNASIERALASYSGNPRCEDRVESIRRTLRSRAGELRRLAQAMLGGVRSFMGPDSFKPAGSGRRVADPRLRHPLASGTHAEVEIIAESLRWRGKVDLLELDDEGCEIVDFKTGAPTEHHAFQVQIYALLWSLDLDLNPGRRRATALRLRYPDEERAVPAPSEEELRQLSMDLSERSRIVKDQVGQPKPPANPSTADCSHCDVRHLCSEYWTAGFQGSEKRLTEPTEVMDAECVLKARLGPANWTTTTRDARRPMLEGLILRCPQPKVDLRPGDVVRVVDGRVWKAPEEPSVPMLNVGPGSELYVVPSAEETGVTERSHASRPQI